MCYSSLASSAGVTSNQAMASSTCVAHFSVAWTMPECASVKGVLLCSGSVRYNVPGPRRPSRSRHLHFPFVVVVVVSKDKEEKAKLYFSFSSSFSSSLLLVKARRLFVFVVPARVDCCITVYQTRWKPSMRRRSPSPPPSPPPSFPPVWQPCPHWLIVAFPN